MTWHTPWGDREEWEWEGQNDKLNVVNTVKEGVNNKFVSTLGISTTVHNDTGDIWGD